MHDRYIYGSASDNRFLLFDFIGRTFTPVDRFRMVALFFIRSVDSCLVIKDHPDHSLESEDLHVTMTVFFPRGGFCGNGARFLSYYLMRAHPWYNRYYLHAETGHVLQMNFLGGWAYIWNIPRPQIHFNVSCGVRCFTYMTILDEPHMIQCGAAASLHTSKNEFEMMARSLQTLSFLKDGCNVSFFENKTLHTWERGINRFTQSCGTATMCYAHLKSLHTVKTPGGRLYVNPLAGPLVTHLLRG